MLDRREFLSAAALTALAASPIARAAAPKRGFAEQAYAKAIEWGYSNPKAIDIFAQNMKVPRDIAKKGVDEFYPKSAMQYAEIKDLERSLKDALDYKFIPSPKTPKDIEGLFDIVYKPAK